MSIPKNYIVVTVASIGTLAIAAIEKTPTSAVIALSVSLAAITHIVTDHYWRGLFEKSLIVGTVLYEGGKDARRMRSAIKKMKVKK